MRRSENVGRRGGDVGFDNTVEKWFLGCVRCLDEVEQARKAVCDLQFCIVKCIYLPCLVQLAQLQLSPQEQESPHILMIVLVGGFVVGRLVIFVQGRDMKLQSLKREARKKTLD